MHCKDDHTTTSFLSSVAAYRDRGVWVPYRFADTIEAAALEAITTFCEQHPNEVAEYPIGLFPAADYHDPE